MLKDVVCCLCDLCAALYDTVYNFWAATVALRVVCKAIFISRDYAKGLWNSLSIMQYGIWRSFFINFFLNFCNRVYKYELIILLYTNVTVFRHDYKIAKSDS
jgi:energy-coupling factor transporter transmembrane protein EcfT